ncbi:hypothetical protein AGMMS49959_01820 [Planctomycetales bacterium]|nr:hypothetical protein AGMMS49959_01820 [Planctomycetales bacterium]
MPTNPNHHVAIHGHFYQPPRENPWLGVIEEQESAAPYHHWNERINAECYQPLAGSAVTNADGKVEDLFNCYAHLSFNFGPTLLAYLAKDDPDTVAELRAADAIARQTYQDCGSAIAQAYNHPILPLCDSADRHTQILWGLREFAFRFGRPADSIWLSETGINMATARALIDYGVKFVILSPLQASYCRRFGESEWTGTIDGTIDTRCPYRLFEVDGAGRTHFDRYLDIFFYDKVLSTKVSFEHLLNNADRLQEEFEQRLAPDATLPQIAVIATDGEIYGHHEKYANRALAYFLARSLREKKLTVSNLAQYLLENPPQCEVRLWEGLDGHGSSWSCSHGVARWESNCGCGGEGSLWNQEWRAPLRRALLNLRDAIRAITRRELGGLVLDVADARNDYIDIILTPDAATREKFLARHAQRELTAAEKIKLWSLLEAERYSLLMFTSCGWFFQEISGLEPVQNMRYALRAAELCAEWSDRDLAAALANDLAAATSNIPEQGNGADVFRQQVLPTRYPKKVIAAAHVFAKLLDLPAPDYDTAVTFAKTKILRDGVLEGEATATDRWTTTTEKWYFVGAKTPAGVVFFSEVAEKEKFLRDKKWAARMTDEGIGVGVLPLADRQRFAAVLTAPDRELIAAQLQEIYAAALPLVQKRNGWRLPATPELRALGETRLRLQFAALVREIAAAGKISPNIAARTAALRAEAAPLDAQLPTNETARQFEKIIGEKIAALTDNLTAAAADELLDLIRYARALALPAVAWESLRQKFWQLLSSPPRAAVKNEEQVFATLQQLGAEFSLAPAVTRQKSEQRLRG